MRSEIGAGTALGEQPSAFVSAKRLAAFAHQLHLTFEFHAIDDDLDPVAVANFADGASCQRLRRDMADAGSR